MRTKTINLNGKKALIDKEIASYIKWLNDHGYTTIYSCSGHFPDPLYIIFKDLDSLRLDKLLAALNRYSNISLCYNGNDRYRFEIEDPKKLKILKKNYARIKTIKPLKKNSPTLFRVNLSSQSL
ncbi:MAG: hypothetical protein ACFFCI_01020 [Promethearchaeota archaeon]